MPSPVKCQVPPADRTRLQALVAAPMTPQKHVWRCAIVLATAEGLGTTAIMQRTGKSKVTVWRWQERYAEAGWTACCAIGRARRANRRSRTRRCKRC